MPISFKRRRPVAVAAVSVFMAAGACAAPESQAALVPAIAAASETATVPVENTMIKAYEPAASVITDARDAYGTVYSQALELSTKVGENELSSVQLFVPNGATAFHASVAYALNVPACAEAARNGPIPWQDARATDYHPEPVHLHYLDKPQPFNVKLPAGLEVLTLTTTGRHQCATILWIDARFEVRRPAATALK